jgi:hypothetical protein
MSLMENSSLLTSLFQQFSRIYKIEVKEKVSKDLKSYKLIVRDIPKMLTNEISNINIKVKGSIGIGNTSHYPWIGFFDTRITKSAARGFYVVLLFSDDYDDLYLTLSHGSTRQTREIINKNKDYIYQFMPKIDGFETGRLPSNSLMKNLQHNSNTNGRNYEKNTLFYKKFVISELSESQLIDGLKDLLSAYNACASKYVKKI